MTDDKESVRRKLSDHEKNSVTLQSALAALLLLPLSALAAEQPDKKLMAEAKLSRPQAEAIALKASHGGKVKAAEIEREKGHLVWSFDIAMPKTSTITEVLVDAMDGKVVSLQHENA